jgi:hypothetical protein
MLRFLGRVYGYYPNDPLEAWKVENLISSYYENIGKFYKASMSKNESEKVEHLDALFETYLPKVM